MDKNNQYNNKNAFQKAEEMAVKSGKFAKEKTIDVAQRTYDAEKGGIQVAGKVAYKMSELPPAKQVKKFWHGLGPGLTTGAADDDPSGIATYSQTGAKYGFQLLWLAPLTFPLMAIIQEMCARIGLATGKGLAANIKQYYPKWILYLVATLLFLANSFNIGADLGAMAKATQLLAPVLPFWLLVIGFVVISLIMQIFISYNRYSKYLKYLALLLLVYIATAFVINDFPWRLVIHNTFIPTLTYSKDQIILICGILGTTISPYLFFWETSQEVEEKISAGKTTLAQRQEINHQEIKKMRLDVWMGMLLSNLVMFFIIAVAAGTLFQEGIVNINTAAEAAEALRPLAGHYAFLLFAIGIIGTGLLAIPVLAGSASYAISESFGWREGLYLKFRQGIYFYSVIILSMLIGLSINFLNINPIKALIYSAVANGLVAPIILIFILKISSNRHIMNSHHNSKRLSIIGWIITIAMIVTGIATVISLL